VEERSTLRARSARRLPGAGDDATLNVLILPALSYSSRRICNGPEALRWRKIDARGVGEARSNARGEECGRDQASVFEKSIGRGSDQLGFWAPRLCDGLTKALPWQFV
jgi:hypothetical protein